MEEKCVDSENKNVIGCQIQRTKSATESSSSQQIVATRPTTSRASSVSQLTADEYSVSNSQHDFAEVLDDETTTSAVLETFEISSNSIPTASDMPSAVVPVEDSSSIDIIKHADVSDVCESTNPDPVYFNGTEVFVINDEDDEVVDNDINADETESGHRKNSNNSSDLLLTDGTMNLEQQQNGIIVTSDGSKIFLETPVVEEQSHHISQIGCVVGSLSVEYNDIVSKSKRLNNEFMLDKNAKQTVSCDSAKFMHVEGSMDLPRISSKSVGTTKGIKSDIAEHKSKMEVSNDRMMSVCLKKMSLTNINANSLKKDISQYNLNSVPSGSQQSQTVSSIADTESMDLIERRDFETEQRLTGGSILKSNAIVNKNMLNISLIKSCMQQEQQSTHKDQTSRSNDDEWPSNSNERAISSDSKCTYKDLSSTPTSSRKYNSRLSKSTTKLNLCASLSHHVPRTSTSVDQSKDQPLDYANISCTHTSVRSPSVGTVNASAVNQEPSASTSTANTSSMNNNNSENSGSVRSEIYSTNSNSNDYPTTSERSCQQHNCHISTHPTSVSAQLTIDGGCSRTSALHSFSIALAYEDAQPSTSSARCQYASAQRNSRQVNASAQTNERFLSRSSLTGGGILGYGNDNANVNSNIGSRNRRRADSSVQTLRSNVSGDVIIVDGEAIAEHADFSADDSWPDCDEENVCSDMEEICTCQNSVVGSSHGGSNMSLNDTVEIELNEDEVTVGDYAAATSSTNVISGNISAHQRKRKYNDGRLLDNEYCLAVSSSSSGGSSSGDNNCRKRIAYDFSSTPRSSQSNTTNLSITAVTSPVANFICGSTHVTSGSPIGRRTPRSLIPTRDNPPPELQQWLIQFQRWSNAERLMAVDRLIEHCDPSQVRHMMKVIEPQFQRDFISLLPRELALSVLSYLEPKDLLRAAQTCRSWRFLCDDNLLWKEKCRKIHILTEPRTDRPKRGRAGNMPPISSPWKAAYMRQHIIEMNWRSRPIRDPKVLKGHDDHVITCLQFSGNRIVSGSDDNTLKVWSAVTGRCLRTLVGHTGGVWSSQMSGNIIISGSTDRTLKVWDMETGICVHTLQGHTSTVRCMHLHGNKVVSGSRDATLRVWDIEQGTCLHVLVGHLAAVRCVQYDGKLIVSGAYDYMVKIWHPERQECLHTLQGHTNRVYSLQFDGIHVVSGSLDTSIRVWDVETGNCKHTLMGHQSLTSGMELRQNILVSGNADSTVKVWDITTGQCLQTLSGPNKHQSAVTCLQFNSRFVVTSSDDGTVKLWDVKTGEFIRNLVALDSGGSGGVVWRIRANDTKLICAVGSRNGTEETKLMVLDFDVEGACVKCS